MAFDGNAVFQRLFSWTNDKNNGINIRADRMDSEMQGFADGLSRAFLRDGSIAMSNPFRAAPGTAAAPGITASGFETTGLYYDVNGIHVTVNGTRVAGFGAMPDFTAAGFKVAPAKPIQGQPAYTQAVQNVVVWASSITLDLSFINSRVVLGGATTFANPTNMVPGQSGTIILQQDATGNRVPAFGSYFKWPAGGGVPSFSTVANAIDEIAYYVETPTIIKCTATIGWGG